MFDKFTRVSASKMAMAVMYICTQPLQEALTWMQVSMT